MRAEDIMTRTPVCVRPSTPLGEIAAILTDNGFSAVPVVDAAGTLLGLVSEADLIRERFGLHPHSGAGEQPRATAAEVMTSPVEFVRPETTLTALAKCMITGHRRSVPVVEGERVVGVVTRRDVVQTMARTDDAILDGVHHQLQLAGFPHRWLIRVQAGVVHLWGEADPTREREAIRVTESVPGVIRVTVSGPTHAGVGTSAVGSAPGVAQTHR